MCSLAIHFSEKATPLYGEIDMLLKLVQNSTREAFDSICVNLPMRFLNETSLTFSDNTVVYTVSNKHPADGLQGRTSTCQYDFREGQTVANKLKLNYADYYIGSML